MMSTKVSERLCDRRDVYRRALADPVRFDVAFYAGRYVEAMEAEVDLNQRHIVALQEETVRREIRLKEAEAEVERLQARERELEAARDSAWSGGYSAGARAAHRAVRAAVSAETEES